LSISAARDTFCRIHKNAERSDLVDKILDQLDFHPLSITLLATVSLQNKWGIDRLVREWEQQRTRMLQTMHNKSFATTIGLSLASPMFQELGPDARGLLEVVAVFPQGVDENNLGWLFPAISNGTKILDKFCVLSLTYRNDSFITMLAPLRDHFRPKDPLSSPFLCTAKKQYFTWMSANINPNDPRFRKSQWITSEDVNVEHLLDVFTTIDAGSESTWDACANFISHLTWHKKRLIMLRLKVERLPDDHRSKPKCLSKLAGLFRSVGNHMECKRLLTHTLTLRRKQGDGYAVARTLRSLSDANRRMGLHEEGKTQVDEASKVLEQIGDVVGQARCLRTLAVLLESAEQLDAAEETASRAINLFSENGNQFQVCQIHRLLGRIYRSKGETDKAIHNFEVSSGTASSFNWHNELVFVHFALAELFLAENKLDDACTHVERVKSHAVNHTYHLGRAMRLQAKVWHKLHRLEEAKAEALRAADVFE